MSEIEKNTEDYLNNLRLQIKLQQVGLSSWGDEKPREQNKVMQTPYSAKMVDDYKRMLETPYTDETGTYKYKQLPPPDLEKADETKLIPLKRSSTQIEQEIKRLKGEVDNLELEKIKLIDTINKVKINIEINASSIDEIAQKSAMMSSKRLKSLEPELTEMEADIKDINEELQRLFQEKETAIEAEATNKDIILDVSRLNQIKLKTYKEDLNQLNKGALNLEQQPGESEEDYLARIKTITATPYDDADTLTQARTYNIQKFKDNMKELIRNDVKIDQVLNTVKFDNADGLFLFNQKFPVFKTDFLKTYGFNNEDIKYETIVDEIKAFLEEGKLPTSKYNKQQYITQKPLAEEQPQEEQQLLIEDAAKTNLLYELQDNNKTLKITNEDNNKQELYFKLRDVNAKGKIEVFSSLNGQPNTYKNIFFNQHNDKPNDRSLKYLFTNHLGLTVAQYRKELPSNSQNPDIKTKASIIAYLKSYHLDEDNENENFTIGNKIKLGASDFNTYGMGLKLHPDETVPKVCSFGKLQIQLHKLYYKNILAIQTPNGLKLPGFKNTPVSDGFVNIVMKLCRNQEPNIHDMNNIKSSEKPLLDSLLQVAGLHKRNITGSSKESVSHLKKQLAIIEGEIEAGNNNKLLKEQLYDVLFKLVHFGIISETQARTHYKNIIKEYF